VAARTNGGAAKKEADDMRRTVTFLYGLVCYTIFLGTFLYMVGFVADFGVPKGIDSGTAGALPASLAVDALLLMLFAVQHTVMARPAFKRGLRRLLPRAAERSTFVLASSLALIVLVWQWRPLPATVWEVHGSAASQLLWGVCALGWATVLFGTFMISHTHLFGLTQVWAHLRNREIPEPQFQTRWLYRYVRHPLMLGFIIAFWATPRMTVGHLVFAAASTGYIVLGTLAFEERDLERYLGEPYQRYRRTVPAFIPHLGHGVRTEDFIPGSDEVNVDTGAARVE
jgi:protein-S-isoprenylcysteine O-methyltransferase Ste14